jgi:hypothetical protein
MKDLFVSDLQMGLDDSLYEPFSVLAATMGAKYVFAVACDDVVVIDGGRDIGGGIFGDEFFIGSTTEVADEAAPLVFGVLEAVVAESEEGQYQPVGGLYGVVEM